MKGGVEGSEVSFILLSPLVKKKKKNHSHVLPACQLYKALSLNGLEPHTRCRASRGAVMVPI